MRRLSQNPVGIALFLAYAVISGLGIPRPIAAREDAEIAPLPLESLPGEGCWVDPRLAKVPLPQFRVTGWFEAQLLGDGEAYSRRTAELTEIGRRELRQRARRSLQEASRASQAESGPALEALVDAETISALEFHWIVNGFTCQTSTQGIEALSEIPGVRCLFFAGPVIRRNVATLPPPNPAPVPAPPAFDPDAAPPAWFIESLRTDRAWKDHGATGKGVLNVVHDGNFLHSPAIMASRYTNPAETANGEDDDGNGLVDDLHGFDFDFGRPHLVRQPVPADGRINARLLHGHQCVALVCSRATGRPITQYGLAPDSQWAGVLANQRIEAAVEWAIEHDADTYSMSFSRPQLGDYRSHWRKMLEHGALCGVHFVSGAGNFAQEGSAQFAPVPVQMRVPEDIPHVVFAAAGVQQDLSRTPFSSQGPVEWSTHHYREGRVDKPEVAAFNFRLPLLLPDGRVVGKAANGNSFAGPMFCGTIALMLSVDPDLNPWQTREIIIRTARDIGPDGYDHQTGHGLIDAGAAVAAVAKRLAAGAAPKAAAP